jgi:hypothetical protein
MSKGVQIAGGATLIALLLGWYAASNLEAGASYTYFQTLADFQAAEAAETEQHVRIHGFVTMGSTRGAPFRSCTRASRPPTSSRTGPRS